MREPNESPNPTKRPRSTGPMRRPAASMKRPAHQNELKAEEPAAPLPEDEHKDEPEGENENEQEDEPEDEKDKRSETQKKNGWLVVKTVTPKGRPYFKFCHPDGKQKFWSKKQAEKAGFKDE